MDIQIITSPISNQALRSYLNHPFPDMVKLVVDVEKRVIALGGEMHSDAEELLLEHGSKQSYLWGANIYPDRRDEPIEFSSLINIRPGQNNRSMEIEDAALRQTVAEIIKALIAL